MRFIAAGFMRIFRQSFDVNRLTLYTGIIDFTALQPLEAPIPSHADDGTEQRGFT